MRAQYNTHIIADPVVLRGGGVFELRGVVLPLGARRGLGSLLHVSSLYFYVFFLKHFTT